ncbi:MAG: iron-containing alcohol dehydrogenase [Planctomycetia bacterium]|jgi:alcohol dehydrogenase YqhD (iron-dependent ADH family)
MRNFTFCNPTKIVFGKGTIGQIGQYAQMRDGRALLVYGGGSIMKNGAYDQVVTSLDEARIERVEYSGVKPNPTVEHTRKGIELAKEEKIDFVIAVGGGSVVDEAKAIAAGAVADRDVWSFYVEKVPDRALPVLTVLTMAATGTEMNGGTVLTNHETGEKYGMGSSALYPVVSILDPTTTFSVPANYTAYAGVDAFTHLSESYFTHLDPWAPIQDGYVEAVMTAIRQSIDRAIKKPDDYDARATFMWAASLAWNGLAPAGVGDWWKPNHMIGHSFSALYDTPHGASLSVVLPAWLDYQVDQGNVGKIARFAKNVFGQQGSTDAATARAGVETLRDWFDSIGSPTTLAEAGIPDDAIPLLVENILLCIDHWDLHQYTQEVLTEILQRAQ